MGLSAWRSAAEAFLPSAVHVHALPEARHCLQHPAGTHLQAASEMILWWVSGWNLSHDLSMSCVATLNSRET